MDLKKFNHPLVVYSTFVVIILLGFIPWFSVLVGIGVITTSIYLYGRSFFVFRKRLIRLLGLVLITGGPMFLLLLFRMDALTVFRRFIVYYNGLLLGLLMLRGVSDRVIRKSLLKIYVPTLLVDIIFTIKNYSVLINDQRQRMILARLGKGYQPKRVFSLRAMKEFAGSINALFMRTYNRNERIILAKRSKNFEERLDGM